MDAPSTREHMRQPLPRRLDAPSAAQTAVQDGDRCGQCGGELLRLDRLRFDVNPNTGEPLGKNRLWQVARNTIHHGAAHPADVVLPVIPQE